MTGNNFSNTIIQGLSHSQKLLRHLKITENRMALLPAECVYSTTHISALEHNGEKYLCYFFCL